MYRVLELMHHARTLQLHFMMRRLVLFTCCYAVVELTLDKLSIAMGIPCPFCCSAFPIVSKWLKHIRIVHADSPRFSLTCNLDGCKRTYCNFGTFQNHVYASHDVNSIDVLASCESEITFEDENGSISQDTSLSAMYLEGTSNEYLIRLHAYNYIYNMIIHV